MSSRGSKVKRNQKRREEVRDVVAEALPMMDPRARGTYANALLQNLAAVGHRVVPIKPGNPLEIGARYMQRAGAGGAALFTADHVWMLRGIAAGFTGEDAERVNALADLLELVVAKPAVEKPKTLEESEAVNRAHGWEPVRG